MSSSDSPLDSVDESETFAEPEFAVVFDDFDFAGLFALDLLLWPLPLPAPLDRPNESRQRFLVTQHPIIKPSGQIKIENNQSGALKHLDLVK